MVFLIITDSRVFKLVHLVYLLWEQLVFKDLSLDNFISEYSIPYVKNLLMWDIISFIFGLLRLRL